MALGGLIRSNESDSINETPVLSNIPVIGWLFKRRSRTKQRTNLTVFISPTIIEPRSREGLGEYTKDYLNITKGYAGDNGIFDSLKDPITRWFFHEESPTERFSRNFMKHDEVHTPGSKLPVPATINKNNHSEVQQEQLSQLKNILKDMDNPFKNIAQPILTQNIQNKAITEVSDKKGRKRRR